MNTHLATTPYEVIPADSSEEAIKKSRWRVGMPTRCVAVRALSNADKTYSVFPVCEPVDEDDD